MAISKEILKLFFFTNVFYETSNFVNLIVEIHEDDLKESKKSF